MSSNMYDAYLSVGTKPTAGNVDTVEEGVQEESLTSFLLATLSAAKTIEPVVQEEVETVEEEINNSADYINAYANPAPVKDLEEEVIEEEIVEEEVIEEEDPEVIEEEVVEEETEDLGAFILDTIKSQVVKEVTPEEAIAELQAVEEEVEEVEEEVVEEEEEVVEETNSLREFILQTIAKQAESVITATEKRYDDEANDILENVKSKKDRDKKLAKVNEEKQKAIDAIEVRKEEIAESDTISETVIQLGLADKNAEEQDSDKTEDVEFKGSSRTLKKQLERTIKELFLEEQIKLRKQIELTSGGGGGIGGGTSTLQTNNISDYRSDLDVYFYSGWLQDGSTIFIKRTDGDDDEFATGLTDLESDWANRLNLNYV